MKRFQKVIKGQHTQYQVPVMSDFRTNGMKNETFQLSEQKSEAINVAVNIDLGEFDGL